ncbi:MAG: hypothetical protein ACQEP6_03445 [Patescibacteria group bacterium]
MPNKKNSSLAQKPDPFKRHPGFILLIIFVICWTVFITCVPPAKMVDSIGIETGYLIIFLTALVGISGFASIPFYTMLITLSSTGEFNILLLMLVAAPARSFGDVIFFFVGHKGHHAMNEMTGSKKIKSFSKWLNNKPAYLTPLVAYLYTAAAPLPKELLMIILGLGRVHFRWLLIGLILGNATFIAMVYFLSVQSPLAS